MLFNYYLLRLIAASVVIGVFPIAMSSLPGKFGWRWSNLIESIGTHWLKVWLVVASGLGLVELGRWLPWAVIRALPELAVFQLAGFALLAIVILTKHWGANQQDNWHLARIAVGIGLVVAWCLTLIWLGGHYA